MGFWDAVVLIVIVVAIARVRIAKYGGSSLDWHDWRDWGGRRRDRMMTPPPVDSRLSADVAELSRRIAVLERIALDDRKKHDIAAEIEALRDKV